MRGGASGAFRRARVQRMVATSNASSMKERRETKREREEQKWGEEGEGEK